ncbi:nuclear pore complex protein Nup133 [Anthonomus grandis grandis]|uniref:nuclear pore complex protein Nup133 n=1 Tax=Anthonomus grandis grandis TaxID=2921223 RepID=UPI002165ADD2|nr:nuclear pore complex protein Nup133 [Anthonomus grandis grandis]XP_050314137.1 nuclear pore complex protein Nup133 [Anthonomus grandis grandis]
MDFSFRKTNLMNSPFSPNPRGRRISLSKSSNEPRRRVHIIMKTPKNVVERFGLPVPVYVEEAFLFADKNATITAKVSENGYAWVVCGRKLFVWQFQNTLPGISPKPKSHPVCYELKLPQSDLAHKAELATVFVRKNESHASCIAVSPEGVVRYWPDVRHDHTSIDKHVSLDGQECDSLVEVENVGCVFVTTTCTLVLVQYRQGKYEPELVYRILKTPGSWFGGLSKRVSSIFFGPLATEGSETRIIRLLSVQGIQQSFNIFVLAALNFQKWLLTDHQSEQLIWSTDLSKPLKESFRAHVSHWEIVDYTDIDVWVLDIQHDKDGVLMLCAGVNMQISSTQLYYGLVSFATNTASPPTETKDFLLLSIMGLYNEANPGEALSYRFTLSGPNAYIYTNRTITVVKPQEEADKLDFLHPDDHIFSGCSCLHVPIFFSKHYGLVAILAVDSDLNTTMSSTSILLETTDADTSVSTPMNNLTVYHMNPEEIYRAHNDIKGQLMAAFIFHVKNQLTECYDLVNKLFPSDVPTMPSFDSPLDTTVLQIGKELLDDIPAGDPRWTHGRRINSGIGSSHSMLVLQQLRDKQKAYDLYLTFLKESGLRDKLAGVNVRNTETATINILAELAEKIAAAIILKGLPVSYVLDSAMERAVTNYSTQPSDGLSKQDIFFREISRIHEGFLWLAKICEECSHSTLGPDSVAIQIHEGNKVTLAVLTGVLQYRKSTAEIFTLNELSREMKLEYIPWTAAEGPEGLVDALMLQHSLTVNYGIKTIGEGPVRDALIDDFVMLTDILLDGKKTHINMISQRNDVKSQRETILFKHFCSDRKKLIRPLVQVHAYEKAAMLAEKYLDFDILLRICEVTNNEGRVEEYLTRFKDTDFPEFVYNWYMSKGKEGALLKRYQQFRGDIPEGRERLVNFLSNFSWLSWIQQTYDKDFRGAAESLCLLGETEKELVTRKKAMFSLCKLSILASSSKSKTESQERVQKKDLEDLNSRLNLIHYQELIPDYVLQQYGADPNYPKVLEPRQIISLYICPEYTDATELDFHTALKVSEFIEDEGEKVEEILRIWRAAILRDSWEFSNLDDPIDCLQNTLFFRLADFLVTTGQDPNNILPPIEMLLEDDCVDKLKGNLNFQSLLKTGYEHFHRTLNI